MAKQSFQLKPRHLLTATLLVSIVAVIALVIGVAGTFKSDQDARKQSLVEQKTEQQDNGVEVWKPSGTSGQEAAHDDTPHGTRPFDESRTESADADNGKTSARSRDEARGDDEEQPRRARPRSEREREAERVQPLEVKPEQASSSLQQPSETDTRARGEAKQEAEKPKAEPKPEPNPEPKHEPKPEAKPEPKAEPKPESKAEPKPEPKHEPKHETQHAPQHKPKPQPKEVMDNLF